MTNLYDNMWLLLETQLQQQQQKICTSIQLQFRIWPLFTISLLVPGWGTKLATHLHLVQRLIMCGAIPPLPHMSSWHGA